MQAGHQTSALIQLGLSTLFRFDEHIASTLVGIGGFTIRGLRRSVHNDGRRGPAELHKVASEECIIGSDHVHPAAALYRLGALCES